jgi:hypothetical protein
MTCNNWSKSCVLSVLKMVSKRLALEVMRFVYCIEICQVIRPLTMMKFVQLRTTCTLSVPNIKDKQDVLHLKEFVLWGLTLQPICEEYSLETCLTPSNVIHVLAFDIHFICSEYASKHDIFKPRNSCYYARLSVYLYWIWTGNMTREKWWNKCPRWNSSVIKTASKNALGEISVLDETHR